MTDHSFWSNLAKVVTLRTYARKDSGRPESWNGTVSRVVEGNCRVGDRVGVQVSADERAALTQILLDRKGSPAGRGLWFSGAPAHSRIGGAALVNCWGLLSNDWMNFVLAMDLLMLGGGVGMSVEREYVHDLPKVRKGIKIEHRYTKDADFIVPDSREGWVELLRRTLEAFFVTGRGFSYSTVCVRGAGEVIAGFGGRSSGPLPLIEMIRKVCEILEMREGRKLRSIDAADVLCSIGECVVAGNVRRSALMIVGDPWDKEFLRAKRWDLGVLPSQRGMANWSVNCSDVEDLHPTFWKTYEFGEAFGIVNMATIRRYGRMGEVKPDTARIVNPCAEATLEDGEPCNLVDIPLPRLVDEDEFESVARLLFRYAKRVTCEPYHHPKIAEVIARNRRIGVGITGCMASPLFTPSTLDRVYLALQDEDARYSKELGVPTSIRTTVIKPSGTLSKVFDLDGVEGIGAPPSRHIIQRVRFAASDPMVESLRKAGHHVEPAIKLDNSLDHSTVVVDFYVQAPDSVMCVDEGWDTSKQLNAIKMAQAHWADQSISSTVYYKKEEVGWVRDWLTDNLDQIKTVAFMVDKESGFKQLPKEPISKEQFKRLSGDIKPVDFSNLDGEVPDSLLDGLECVGGACPVR